ncbi:MAG TPA: LysR family transcriptional regulator [Ramlibacter sp.]|nr:LysR family transcriptional regulator [Ramlibacter sp.]
MNLRTLDLNLLRVFAAVYAEKNVTRAAVRLEMSQPAISNAMARLRRTMDDPLFVRTSRGMEPTALAVRLAQPVEQALELLRTTFDSGDQFDPKTATKTFRVLMSDAGEAAVIPQLVARLDEAAPHVRVHAVVAPHAQYANLLEEGSADLAVGNLRFLTAGFYQQRLFNDPYRCICSPGHPLARNKQLSLRQFVEAAHVAVEGGNAEPFVDQVLARKRLQRDIRFRLSNYHVAVQVVLGSHLLATVPQRVVTPEVRAFELPMAVPPAEVRQFWHLRAHHDPANAWFRSLLARLFAGRRET